MSSAAIGTGLARTVSAELVCHESATVVYEVPLVPREESGYTEAEQVKQSQTQMPRPVAGHRRRAAGAAVATGGLWLWTLQNAQALLNGTAGTPGQRRPC